MVKKVIISVAATAAGMIGAAVGFSSGATLGGALAAAGIIKAGAEPTETSYLRTGAGPFGKRYRVDYKPIQGTGSITQISKKDYKAAVAARKEV